ncbi:unnamed protein product [Schistocephalus solidus]|uniref:Secretory carrier-associated membrane protein n=1 Tax=Schistocephalus solidus TaxID=70667 RepID=A0A183TMD2_SCHSO|nr:unnamed protein product [Schistocephalus solidus]
MSMLRNLRLLAYCRPLDSTVIPTASLDRLHQCVLPSSLSVSFQPALRPSFVTGTPQLTSSLFLQQWEDMFLTFFTTCLNPGVCLTVNLIVKSISIGIYGLYRASADLVSALNGWINSLKTLQENTKVAAFMIFIACLYSLAAAASAFLLIRAHSYYRGSGASTNKAKQELAREILEGRLRDGEP